ncbi:glutaredoxin domain-containing protein [Bacillus mycoides]|uniref:glutaredoxin family protein n=1 Tax=Bacillus mycoides TaxID=1405 RepID=UPI002E1D61F4|nr:glutaredoxin domain-containing protein [Bacillus mycoides]MED1014529.1 glutaredoxin domain-containing protein [Bacillus mycoides]MED1047663.1 glutaredoxin domain-containing protein [Bacillus mycoides]MED1054400.1 glutaredoxin domain-containing protein [Bacillus mycoides]
MSTKIVMFTQNKCPNCKRAKEHLSFAPVDIVLLERNIDDDKYWKHELENKYKSMSLPTFVFENGNVVIGFDEGKIMTELGL